MREIEIEIEREKEREQGSKRGGKGERGIDVIQF